MTRAGKPYTQEEDTLIFAPAADLHALVPILGRSYKSLRDRIKRVRAIHSKPQPEPRASLKPNFTRPDWFSDREWIEQAARGMR